MKPRVSSPPPLAKISKRYLYQRLSCLYQSVEAVRRRVALPPQHARHMRARPGHVHYALFRASSGQCLLNQASAGLAGSATCIDCVPEGGSLCNLKPTRSWNKQGWMIEDMP